MQNSVTKVKLTYRKDGQLVERIKDIQSFNTVEVLPGMICPVVEVKRMLSLFGAKDIAVEVF